MNAVEIEQAITELAEQPFDAETFPFTFLEAFGKKATTIKKIRFGASSNSDMGGANLCDAHDQQRPVAGTHPNWQTVEERH